MPDYSYCVSLKISHPTINPQDITKALNIKPTRTYTMGDPRKTVKGKLLGGVYEESLWSFDLHSEKKIYANQKRLEDFIAEQNEKLKLHKEYFHMLSQSGGHVEYFIGWFSEGTINMNIILEPKLLKTTSELDIALNFHVYPDE